VRRAHDAPGDAAVSRDAGLAFGSVGRVVVNQNLTVYPGEGRPTAGPSYLAQVRRIAPPVLEGREAELAELAAFCLEPGRGPYAWWQAGPWAGKSALLSSFVLSPPPQVAERVRFVAFFITARLASQDSRQAYTQWLLEQLAALTGQAVPAVAAEDAREALLLDLLAQAAEEQQRAGGRLVLVVDGLDEDRGVTTGPDAHSIAGLLPAEPPAGMRVIVAGRPNPPVPDDVPDWHPLRHPGIIRPLAASPYARDAQRLGRQELQRLLRGSPAELDVLGLLTAARGGLTARDLAELAGLPLWEAEGILHTAAGRTFARRPARWAPGTGPEVYLLGHEELQNAAAVYLDGSLPEYRGRLHAWAGTHRQRGWSAGTPEYLLDGYYALLSSLGELPGMTEYGTDPARHDLMLDVTGADAAALAQIRTALDLTASQDAPNLANALSLAYCRDRLSERSTSIPYDLPAVWASIGQPARAEALAASADDHGTQASILAEVAGALAQSGHQEQAAEVFRRAETLARSVTDPELQSGALFGVVRALTNAEQYEQAERVARSIADPAMLGRAVVELAEAQAELGEFERAEALTSTITRPGSQAEALAAVAGARAQSGQYEHAQTIARQAEAVARSITNPREQRDALVAAAGALARSGQHGHAEVVARSITDPGAGSGVAGAGAVGRVRACRVANQHDHPSRQAG
jgi:tetratricopeptide (TPR) repeat protein